MDMIKKHFKKIWWAILLTVTTYYFYSNYQRISMNPSAIDSLITAAFMIIIFMPLISEISLLGMSVKKEMERVKNEMKDEVKNIRNDIMSLMLVTNNSNSIYVNSERVPTEREVKLTVGGIDESAQKDTESSGGNEVSDNSIFLFKTRLILEKKIEEVVKKYELTSNQKIITNITLLRHYGIITPLVEDKLLKILAICNRGVHGELVDDEYVSYVKVVLKELNEGFENPKYKKELKMNRFTVCDRCGYTGASFYDNQCPKCGAITDSY